MRLLWLLAALVAVCRPAEVRGRRGPTPGWSKVLLHRKLAAVVPDDFLSFAVDDGVAKKNWEQLDLGSERLARLVRALQPAVLRFGGTQADCMIFQEDVSLYSNVTKCHPFQKKTTPFQLTDSSWLPLAEFVNKTGSTLLYDLNSLLRDSAGRWVDTNARHVIRTVTEERLPVIWQLGNEPNSYQHKFNYSVPPETLAADFAALRQLLGPDSQLVGPDVNRPHVSGALQERPVDLPAERFLERFLAAGNATLDAVTFHQYYFDGRTATIADFVDARHFALLARQIEAVRGAADGAAIWLSETGSAWGGGAAGLSDAFVAGFLWLDKLGTAARLGLRLVVRQSLYGGHYALLDPEMRPNPDYWLSYVYKLVIGPKVLTVEVSGPETVRMYCHCGHRYLPRDSVSCFTLNFGDTPEKIKLDDSLQQGGIQYMMTAPNGNITARGILCNGHLLELNSDSLPVLVPQSLPPASSLTLPAYSMAFHVFRRAAPRACMASV